MIHTEQHHDVRVLVIDSPPVNALGAANRRALQQALDAAARDPATAAIVIRGAGRLFSGGADIKEFNSPPVDPSLPDLIDAVEACGKPVVAALHGTAFGGGLELPLGCHYRLAAPSAKLGLPEVKLGLLPGAGGTQRLPRVIGVAASLVAIVGGDPIPADRAQALGLVDRIVREDHLTDDAVAFAREIAIPNGSRRTADRAVASDPDAIDSFVAANAARLRGLEAPAACIEAIRAATTLPFREGLAHEVALFMRLAVGRQSQAMRHLFFAERAAARIDGLPPGLEPLPVRTVGIVGAGTMGSGIATGVLQAGFDTVLVERDRAALDRGVALIARNTERSVAAGRLTAFTADEAMARLAPTLDFAAIADCDLVIEAVFEDLDAKIDVFRRLDATARPDAILASNTSFLDIDRIAAATSRPDRVLGLHFFSPANIMRLLEIVRGARTSPGTLATALALSRRLGKIAVVAGNCHGFIGNRMLEPRQREATRLLLEGATPSEVDGALLEFGMKMGPFEMADLAGLDLGWSAATSTGATIRDLLCERGRRGRKTGAGFYDYADGRRTPSPEVERTIRDVAGGQGIRPRTIEADEIRERLLYPMINEAALILQDGIAQRASDVDVVWVHGYGWPAITGGPLFWADGVGLDRIVAGLEAHRSRPGPEVAVAGLLAAKAADRTGFYTPTARPL